MLDVQTISIVVIASSVVIAAIALIQRSSEAKKDRQAELFMSFYARF